jgi:hypothetical protein
MGELKTEPAADQNQSPVVRSGKSMTISSELFFGPITTVTAVELPGHPPSGPIRLYQ